MGDLKLPAIDYGALSPMLILFGAACVGVLIEALVPKRVRHTVQLALALVSVVVAFVAVIFERNSRTVTIGGAVAVDGPTLFLQGAVLYSNQTGQAIKVDGRWMITRESECALLALGSIACPPRT